MPEQQAEVDEPLGQAVTNEEAEFVELLRESINGGLERDTAPNSGKRFDDDALKASRTAYRAFLKSDLFSELQPTNNSGR